MLLAAFADPAGWLDGGHGVALGKECRDTFPVPRADVSDGRGAFHELSQLGGNEGGDGLQACSGRGIVACGPNIGGRAHTPTLHEKRYQVSFAKG